MYEHKVTAVLYDASRMIEHGGIEDVLRTILRVGCNDVSQSIGHYFSCTDSVVRMAEASRIPSIRNHIFLLVTYIMQSSPILLSEYETPESNLEELLSGLVKKGGFVGYHYMILANALIKRR